MNGNIFIEDLNDARSAIPLPQRQRVSFGPPVAATQPIFSGLGQTPTLSPAARTVRVQAIMFASTLNPQKAIQRVWEGIQAQGWTGSFSCRDCGGVAIPGVPKRVSPVFMIRPTDGSVGNRFQAAAAVQKAVVTENLFRIKEVFAESAQEASSEFFDPTAKRGEKTIRNLAIIAGVIGGVFAIAQLRLAFGLRGTGDY